LTIKLIVSFKTLPKHLFIPGEEILEEPLRFGVYIPGDLARDLEECMRITDIRNRSRIVQEALRLFITEHKWRSGGSASGIIGVIYNHEVKGADELLTDVQHEFLDIIVSTVHVHLDRERCMLAIIVRGNTEKIKSLLNKIMGIRGVLVVRPILLEVK
jgi:CopG family nickel-responsive transcriptional regulator